MTTLLEMIQQAPVEWKTLGEVCEISTGKSNTNQQSEDGQYPFYVRSKSIKRINHYEYDEEAIIIPGEGGIGEIFHYVNGKYGLHQRAYRIHVVDSSVNTRFIYHCMLQNFRRYIVKTAVSATVTSIRKPMIEQFPIPIPSLATQAKIVEVLDKLTEYIGELRIELTQRTKQYHYYRDYLLSEDYLNQKCEQMGEGEIMLCQLVDVARSISTGVTPKKTNPAYYDNGTIPWLRTNEVKFNTIRSTEMYVTQQALEETSLKWIEANSVIVAISGATAGRVAVTHIPLTTNQHCCAITPNETKIHYRYLYHWLVNQQHQLLELKQGARGDLNMGMIRALPIYLPPLPVQSHIVHILDQFDTLVNDLQQGLPREIELRTKQYHYYREQLLTFAQPTLPRS